MLIAVPREIKNQEYRVGLTPEGVRELVERGHTVLVQAGAGEGVGLSDEHYREAGAEIAATADDIYGRGELVVKVKEPQAGECALLREGQTLFAYLHLAPDEAQLRGLLASGVTAIAYETVEDADGRLPLLAPMSEVAGRMAIQAGAHALEKAQGGAGILLGGVPGVKPARVLIIGGGVVGANAALMAIGMGARVTVMDRSIPRLRYLEELYGDRLDTLYATRQGLVQEIANSDLVVGAVLVAGAEAPKLVTREMLKDMRPGSVLVDVSIDQGGCFETSRPTTHETPTYLVDGIVHYCVANIPSAVARTATYALTNATLPYVVELADNGVLSALRADPGFLKGLNVHRGRVTCRGVAEARGLEYVEPGKMVNRVQD